MTNKEAIKYLKQLYPNGGHCWLDEQSMEAIDMAVKALQEEPVSENFEEALAKEWKGYNDRGAATVDALEDNTQELAFAKGFYRGAEWKADEFEKERLKLCNTLTKEQAQIESDFVVNFIKEHNCTPTFIDAIEHGMQVQKEQMMAKAADMVVGYWMPNGLMLTVDETENCYNIKEDDRVKVIVIKKD